MEFDLTITSVSGEIFSGKCSSLTLPLSDGLYTILPNHSPVVAALAEGIISVTSDDNKISYSISDGLTVFENNSARVLVNNCAVCK